MTLDFNNAPSQQSGDFELLPVGTCVKLRMTIRPGKAGPDGILTQSKSSDAQYLDCEFAISSTPYHGRRVWQKMTVSGGSVDEQGRSKGGMITAASLRAIINSARSVNPNDDSEQARAVRVLNGYADFTGMEFSAKIGKEEGKNGYPDKNKIAVVLEPGAKEYERVMNGETIIPGGNQAPGGPSSSPVADNTPSWAVSTPSTDGSEQPAQQQPQTNNNNGSAVPSWAQ